MTRHSPRGSRGSPDSCIFSVSLCQVSVQPGPGSWCVLVQLQVFQKLSCVKGSILSEYYFSLIVPEALNSRSKPSDGTSWEQFREGECRHAFFVLYLLLVVLYAEQLLGPLALMPNSRRSRSWEEPLVAFSLLSFPHAGLHLSSICSNFLLYSACTGNWWLRQLHPVVQVPLYFSNLFWPLSLNLKSNLWYLNSCSSAVD